MNTHGSPKYATFCLLLKPLIEITHMSLDQEAVSRIAYLARLGVDESECAAYAHNLSAILAFVEQLNAVDTAGVEPMAHPLDTSQRLRPDQVSETDQHEKFQRVAPRVEAGLYLVPKVIE